MPAGTDIRGQSSWTRRSSVFLVLLLLVVGASEGTARASTDDWLTMDGNVLVLRLAHDHRGHVDGGVLSVNPTTRTLTWRGIEGALGCPDSFDVPFDRTRSVRPVRGAAGFELVVRDHVTMTFLPVVDGDWFARQETVTIADAGLNQALGSGFLTMGAERGGGASRDPNPQGMNGDRAFGGARTEKHAIPEEVSDDVRLAVDSVLNTMGRTPSPGLRLREALYGNPEDVGVDELSGTPGAFEGLAVRVRGHVERSETAFQLKAEKASVSIVPSPEVQAAFAATLGAPTAPELELTGVFRQPPPVASDAAEGPLGTVTFWDFVPVTGEQTPGVETVPLERLLESAKSYEGKSIRVVGKFRGNNLFADLPTPSLKSVLDFVVKEDAAAIWVTGMRPEGKGWRLNVQSPGDTQHWVEVVGRPKVQKGIVYLRASQVSVTTPPSGHAGVTEKRLVGTVNVPPEVIFTLPLPGEPVARKGVFIVQFNKPLDRASLKDRVRLAYVGSEHPFTRMNVSYDEDRRALVIDPGEPLEAGRQIDVILLPGILDADGLDLKVAASDGAAYRMRYTVVSGVVANPQGP